MMRYATVLLLFVGIALEARAPQRPDPAALWERMIAAKGGRERLHAVRTIVMSSKGNVRPEFEPRPDVVGGDVQEMVIEFPASVWWWSDYRPGKMGYGVQIRNAPKQMAWSQLGERVTNVGGSEWSAMLESGLYRDLELFQASYLLETAYLRPRPLRVRLLGKSAAILDVALPGYSGVEYSVDLNTYMVTALRMTPLVGTPPEPGLTRAFVFDQYVPVSGLQMPARKRIGRQWNYLAFLINPNIDPAIFETPPVDVKSKDAWRKWLR